MRNGPWAYRYWNFPLKFPEGVTARAGGRRIGLAYRQTSSDGEIVRLANCTLPASEEALSLLILRFSGRAVDVELPRAVGANAESSADGAAILASFFAPFAEGANPGRTTVLAASAFPLGPPGWRLLKEAAAKVLAPALTGHCTWQWHDGYGWVCYFNDPIVVQPPPDCGDGATYDETVGGCVCSTGKSYDEASGTCVCENGSPYSDCSQPPPPDDGGGGGGGGSDPCTDCWPDPPPPQSISIVVGPSIAPGSQTPVAVHFDPAVAGYAVEVYATEAANSGGHIHLGRPLGQFGATSGVTNSNGVFETTYTASKFGGVERLSARATMSGLESTAELTVQVAGLQPLPSGSNFTLVGATAAHPDNHYGTASTVSALMNIAAAYAAEYPGSTLRYNDMSLAQGGLFDIGPPYGSYWNTPHAEHRLGTNCDVSKSNVPADRYASVERVFRNHGATFINEGDHWHLRF